MAGPIGYNLEVTTGYAFGNPFPSSTFLGGGSPNPDTGFFEITNNGTTTFTGTIGDVANRGFGGSDSFTSGTITLAPGQSASIAIGPESSNQGGYNGPFFTIQPGVQILLSGLINGSEAVNLSVFDSAIHSGVARTSPCDGIVTDAYVLQGGSSVGCDTGDAFETSQAQGHYTFFEQSSAVPEPGTLALFGTGALGLFNTLRRKMRG